MARNLSFDYVCVCADWGFNSNRLRVRVCGLGLQFKPINCACVRTGASIQTRLYNQKHKKARVNSPPSTSFLVNSRTPKGGRRAPSVSSRVGSKLPLPLYADVRFHIPMTHRNDAGKSERNSERPFERNRRLPVAKEEGEEPHPDVRPRVGVQVLVRLAHVCTTLL